MAITVYFRRKTDRGWRYEAPGIGRRPEAARTGPYYIRVREKGKYRWQKHLSELAARKAAESAPIERKAQALGLVPDDVTGEVNSNRTPIKLAVEETIYIRWCSIDRLSRYDLSGGIAKVCASDRRWIRPKKQHLALLVDEGLVAP